MESGCATALVLNKWDVTSMDEQELIRQRHFVASKLRQRPPVLTCSALTGRHVDRLLRECLALGDRVTGRVPTPAFNRWLGEVTQIRQPPLVRGKRLKLIYGAQIETRPPRFSIQVNSRKLITRDYAYFLENRLRERFGLVGVPVIMDLVERGTRRRGSEERRGSGATRIDPDAPVTEFIDGRSEVDDWELEEDAGAWPDADTDGYGDEDDDEPAENGGEVVFMEYAEPDPGQPLHPEDAQLEGDDLDDDLIELAEAEREQRD
ncbi:MAG: hypothetical protein PGN13_14735 [Patulibacter minatonensis]